MDLPYLKATALLLHKVTDHHHHRDILHPTAIRTPCQPLPRRAFANLKAGHRVIQAFHLLREDLHHSLATEGMPRHHRSSHQDHTVEDISRYKGSTYKQGMHWADSGTRHHHRRARVTGRLYKEDHSTEDGQVRATLGLYLQRTDLSGLPTANTNAYTQGNPNAPRPPPPDQQTFGQGAPSHYSFQYSNCTGRRKALLIGINYFGQKGQLRGCINDVKNMSTYLNGNFGYAREDMVILTDDQQNPMSQPTKQNILRAMHWLVKDAKPNDSLFFHYSGQLRLRTHKARYTDSRRARWTNA